MASKAAEKRILVARTPMEYIDRSIKSRLTSREKARIALLWMSKTGYTSKDIREARSRHPYWKSIKMSGNLERTERRFRQHNYRQNKSKKKWDIDKVQMFLELNIKDKNGVYIYKDWQIAKKLKTSIPSVQYWRRKRNMILKILGSNATPMGILEYLSVSEQYLRQDMNKRRKKSDSKK